MGTGRPLKIGGQPTPDIRAQAIGIADATDQHTASEITGVPQPSISRWQSDPRSIASGIESRAFVSDKRSEWAAATLQWVQDGWQEAANVVRERLADPDLSPADIKALVTSYAILVDKRQVLTGGPTSTRFGVSVQHHTSDKQPRVDVSKLLSANEPEPPDAS